MPATTGTLAQNRELTVGEVAASAGVTSSAIRFYNAHGLIASRRNAGNQRRFSRDAACRVRMIRVCQRIGMTVTEIRRQLAAVPGDARPEDWTALGERLEGEVRERIRALRSVLSDLASEEWLCELPTITDTTHGRLPYGTAPMAVDGVPSYHTV
ncbi:MerR family transcriptional regulator [Microbacterium oxydans]|uniref:MerR family transcriptional regulator n=1 Tax=Microbacterium oxydans TaxID=82380 RepID=UPI00362C11BE